MANQRASRFDKTRMNHARIWLVLALMLLTIRPLLATNADVAAQVVQKRLFPEPLAWVGNQPPDGTESLELLTEIGLYETNGINAGIDGLEQFLQAHPQSEWSPSLRVNLAEYYREHGRYSLALAHWQAAWNATKDGHDANAQDIAVRTIAGWSRLLASLGEKEQLMALFSEVDARQLPLGIYATKINETKEGLGVMQNHPGAAYRCGSFALGQMALVLGMDKQTIRKLFEASSPDGGFHVSELLKLAQTNGLAVAAVRRPEGADLVVPSVVHWKLNHFAAITAKKGDLYRVVDPTFEKPVWMDATAIEAEASGEFILPKDKVPASWKPLTAMECASIYGKGYPTDMDDDNDSGPPSDCPPDDDSDDSDCDPPASNDGSGGGGGGGSPNPPTPPPCPDCGMPQWSVTEPYITLWLKDSPLAYHQSSGKWMQLRLSYKSRSSDHNTTMGGFGDKWSCNWLGMLQSSGGGAVEDCRAGGGHESFPTDGSPSYKSARIFRLIGSSPAFVPVLCNPRGAFSQYALGQNYVGVTNNLLTDRIDRYGRSLQKFNYLVIGNSVRMTNMFDLDGRTNVLVYANATFTNLITAVTDPYGHTAHFYYNTVGLLTNITDVAGMTTYFYYDGDENITNMVTPYGTTSFQYLTNSNTTGEGTYMRRGLLVTEATGDNQLYEYLDNGPYNLASYYWNRAQYASISSGGKANPWAMSDQDYNNARLKYWLLGDETQSRIVSDSVFEQEDPYEASLGGRPNIITYQYYGESYPFVSDGNPALKALTEIDSSYDLGQVITIQRNGVGRPVVTTYYDHYNSETSASFTNYYDSGGTILQYELGPHGELTRGYGYDPVLTNLLVSVTNAVGDVLRYTHDPTTLKVTSIKFPGGLIRTNFYYTSGPQKGFLQQQIDIGIRTNSFSYLSGNLYIQTNELGLVTTNLYDNLNRLISTAYPDGSTVSNIYNKLDIVATKDRLNQWAYYGYNEVRQLRAMTNVNGQVTTYDYCGCGAPDQIIRWNGTTSVTTTFSYNIGGLLTNATFPDSYQLNYSYDNDNRITQVTDGAGNQLQLYYEKYGLKSLLSAVTLGGPYTYLLQQSYDEYGRVTNSVDRNSVVTTQSYDFVNRLATRQVLSYSTPDGPESFVYNALGLTNYTDPLGHLTTYVRDNAGRVLYQTNANVELQQFTYNSADELLTLTDGKGQATRWGYDAFGRMTNKVDALGTNILRYQYDANNRLTNRWSVAKGGTTYKYDPIGNLTNVLYPISSNLVFRYDPLNRLTNMLDGVGSTAFGWTLGDQLAGETGPWANDAINYTYNGGHQRSGLSLAQPNSSPWSQTYLYDTVMRLTDVISPAGDFNYGSYAGAGNDARYQMFAGGNCYVYKSYDDMERLYQTTLVTAINSFSSPTSQFQYGYDTGSERTQQVFTAGNLINYTYDKIGQLKTAQGFEADGVTARLQEQFGYAYDSAWNLNRRTNNVFVQIFGVNKLNELTNGTRSGTFTVAGTATEPLGSIYGYPAGVTNVTVSGTGLSSGAATIYADGSWARSGATLANGNNTYTAVGRDTYNRTSTDSHTVNLPATMAYSYDLNGNLLSDGIRYFAYDDENELVSAWVSGSWSNSFAYDGLLRKRIERDYQWNAGTSGWVKTNEVRYVYDANLVIQERDANNLPLVTYTRGNDMSGSLQGAGGIGGLLARTDNGQMIGNNPYAHAYYYFDANGNVIGLVNTNGYQVAQYTYDPFGNVLTMSGPLASANSYRFSSKEWNENSGLYYYGRRFYDPNLQRWLNRDPIKEQGGINLYGFVWNNPLSWIDYLGLATRFVPPGWQGPPAPGDTIVHCPQAPSPSPLRNNMEQAESVGNQYPPSQFNGANDILDKGWLANQVATDHPWDYKNQPTHGANPEYTDFGNFNFGAAGSALGLDPWELQEGAGVANQMGNKGSGGEVNPGSPFIHGSGTPPYGDQPNDNNWIKNGIEYNKQYPVGGKPGPCG